MPTIFSQIKNQKSKIINHQSSIPSSISIRSLRTADKNSNQLIAFSHRRRNIAAISQLLPGNDLEPHQSLPQILQGNLHLVNEILPRFRTSGLTVVRRRRRSRPHQLPGDRVTCFCVRQALDHRDHQHREINQSIFKFLRSHLPQNQKSKIYNLSAVASAKEDHQFPHAAARTPLTYHPSTHHQAPDETGSNHHRPDPKTPALRLSQTPHQIQSHPEALCRNRTQAHDSNGNNETPHPNQHKPYDREDRHHKAADPSQKSSPPKALNSQ